MILEYFPQLNVPIEFLKWDKTVSLLNQKTLDLYLIYI